jgi:hypothetical protein
LTGLLIALAVVLGLYGVFLLLAALSNRSAHRLRERLDAGSAPGNGAATPGQRHLGEHRWLKPRWVISILLAAVTGLIGLLVFIVHISRQ